MNSIKSSFEISLQPKGSLGVLQHIEKIARTCYKSEDRITEDGESAKKMCANLRDRKHEAMLEHSVYIVAMNEVAYREVAALIHDFEDSGFISFLRGTSDIDINCIEDLVNAPTRYIMSGNVRAWRDFFRFCRDAGVQIPYYLNIFFTKDADKEIFFSEFTSALSEQLSVGAAGFITRDELVTEIEVLMHYYISVRFTVDRGVSHELVRHRVASFAQESTRYCNYGNEKFGGGITVIDLATGMELDPKISKLDPFAMLGILNEWEQAVEDSERHYMKMIEFGATPQIARSVLPNSTKTEIIMTAHCHEWEGFFVLRDDKAAHPQMREVAVPLHREFQKMLPDCFGALTEEN